MDSPWLNTSPEQERISRLTKPNVRAQILEQYVEISNKHKKAVDQYTDARNKIAKGDNSPETISRLQKAENEAALYGDMKNKLDADLDATPLGE